MNTRLPNFAQRNQGIEGDRIVIIAILAGMLLPALGKVKAMGHKISCTSNMKQIGIYNAQSLQNAGYILPGKIKYYYGGGSSYMQTDIVISSGYAYGPAYDLGSKAWICPVVKTDSKCSSYVGTAPGLIYFYNIAGANDTAKAVAGVLNGSLKRLRQNNFADSVWNAPSWSTAGKDYQNEITDKRLKMPSKQVLWYECTSISPGGSIIPGSNTLSGMYLSNVGLEASKNWIREDVVIGRHANTVNFLYADGHVENMKSKDSTKGNAWWYVSKTPDNGGMYTATNF